MTSLVPDLSTLLAGKKIQPRYLYLDWQFELGVIVGYENWVPYGDIDQYFDSKLNMFTSLVSVQIKLNQDLLQQHNLGPVIGPKFNLSMIHEFSGSYKFDETNLHDPHVLEISIAGLSKLSAYNHNWNGKSVATAVNIKQLNVQNLSAKEVFSPQTEYNAMIFGKDVSQQFVFESPVYHWLLKNSESILSSIK